MTWRPCKLGDVITLQRGHDLPEAQRRDGPVPIISSSGHTGSHDQAKAKGPGVVTGRYGTLGEVYFVEEDYWPLNTALYVVDFKGNDPRFVSYFLKHTLTNLQSDKAAVPGVNRNVLHALEVRCPRRDLQLRIAEILSAYDDLIENNRRRMALLEDAARQLYREWFGRLRFPGHEHTPVFDGLPEGWERRLLFDIATPTYGHPFKSALFNGAGDGLPVARIRDVLAGESATFTPEEGPSDRRLNDGDLLIGMDGDFHMGLWAGGAAWLNQRVVRISGRGEIADYLLFWLLRGPIKNFNETLTGTTVVHLGAKELKTIELLVPSAGRELLREANAHFGSIGNQLTTLKLLNIKLRSARDLLLPRLMSGEVAA